jgi:DNA-binding XRE family transcriptional regulator
MKNALEQYRLEYRQSYADLARVVGFDRATVMRHCKAKTVPEGVVARYHVKLQIPVKDLQPQLFKSESKS